MKSLAIVGATVIDGTGRAPISDAVVLLEAGRIRSITPAADVAVPEQAGVINAADQYVIPGLMDANAHLATIVPPELLIQLEGRYSEAVEEAAQIALRAGLTTIFDTWGPLQALTEVRERINRGELTGSRIFAAGNIIGLPGPISDAFFPVVSTFSSDAVERINSYWEQGVGEELLWLTPEEVRQRVRDYIARSDVDFIKYAASGHGMKLAQFLTFSEQAQSAIVEEAHRAGLTAQAHTESPESLRMEIEAGADLLQHPDHTGPEPIPEEMIKTIVEKQLPCAAMVVTEDYLKWIAENMPGPIATFLKVGDRNDRRLVDAGAKLLLTTDAWVAGPGAEKFISHLEALDFPQRLGEGHFLWLEAVIERGMSPMDALLAATRNIAEAYGQDSELGTLEPGKRADLVILEANPLADVANYRRITQVIKDGQIVDRKALPTRRVVTVPDRGNEQT